ncbi:GNAT family N-acetyltransferase [Jiangella mangrovi]|uniref:GNAT superfamily N-acetyltransferase n=1 Tax=Jiangella mangrovi TaxID=1524084 RepID=A0A7W9GSB1_9ACTN|nr:GNAT family N-acetyltransferase [Jiangella mangrovi]MBB5789138.1 GNAT superfamily N-acetyltransferase [Jiangella mangrovi]
MSELRDVVLRWQAGWVTARDYRSSVDGDVVTVRIGLPDRITETILLTDDPDLYADVAGRVGGPSRWLTAPTSDRARTEAAAVDAGFAVHAPEWLMSRPLDDDPGPGAPEGYEVWLSGRPPVLVAEVVTGDGDPRALAAKGHLALSGEGDADAVADRIFTVPAHRRRGLGSVVMGTLTAAARERGARTGLLVASADGRQLYERLGWRLEAEMTVAHWSGHATPEAPSDPLE